MIGGAGRAGLAGEVLRAEPGVLGQIQIAGQAGADAKLADLVALDFQVGGRQAIEQIIEEHGPEGLLAGYGWVADEIGSGVHGIENS